MHGEYYISRRTPNSGQLCAKPYQLMVMQVWESDILMHEGTFLSTLTIKTIPVFIPCVMPSFCAFSGARSPFAVMPFEFLNLDTMRNLCKSTHVRRHAAVAAGVRGRSHPQAGAFARAPRIIGQNLGFPYFLEVIILAQPHILGSR